MLKFATIVTAFILGTAQASAQDGTAFAHPKAMPFNIECSTPEQVHAVVERFLSDTIGFAQLYLPRGCRQYQPRISDPMVDLGEFATATHRYTLVERTYRRNVTRRSRIIVRYGTYELAFVGQAL